MTLVYFIKMHPSQTTKRRWRYARRDPTGAAGVPTGVEGSPLRRSSAIRFDWDIWLRAVIYDWARSNLRRSSDYEVIVVWAEDMVVTSCGYEVMVLLEIALVGAEGCDNSRVVEVITVTITIMIAWLIGDGGCVGWFIIYADVDLRSIL